VEFGSALRLLYFPLLLNYLLKESEKGALGPNAIVAGLLLYGYLILASLAIGEWSGLGGTIGGRGSSVEAGKGFMIGANEVGLMLLLTCSFVVGDLVVRSRSHAVGAGSGMLVYLLAGGYVFTKSSLAASVLGSFAAYRQFMRGGPGFRFVVNTVLVAGIAFAAFRIADYAGPLLDVLAQTFFAALLDDGLVSFLMRGRRATSRPYCRDSLTTTWLAPSCCSVPVSGSFVSCRSCRLDWRDWRARRSRWTCLISSLAMV